jgi:hypothetical protein
LKIASQPASGDVKRTEEEAGELVISHGDNAVDLQETNDALDTVSLAIHATVAF